MTAPDGPAGSAMCGAPPTGPSQKIPTTSVDATRPEATSEFQMIAVWVKQSSDGYVKPTLRALDALHAFLSARPTIVLGDFNEDVAFDKRRGPRRRFKDVIAAFETLKMRSAWHAHSGDAHGAEGAPTLHWKWQAESQRLEANQTRIGHQNARNLTVSHKAHPRSTAQIPKLADLLQYLMVLTLCRCGVPHSQPVS